MERIRSSACPVLASNSSMGRSTWGVRGCAAAALMASCLAVTASAQQASVPSSPAGSTRPGGDRQDKPQPQASGDRGDYLAPEGPEVQSESAVSVHRIRESLAREPALRLESLPVFSLTVNERRPRYWDLEAPYLFAVEPRTSTTRWHDEFRSMVTPTEATMYGSMLSASETATIAATSLLFAGAASLLKAGFSEWALSRREGKAREAAAEVDAALAAWALANTGK